MNRSRELAQRVVRRLRGDLLVILAALASVVLVSVVNSDADLSPAPNTPAAPQVEAPIAP